MRPGLRAKMQRDAKRILNRGVLNTAMVTVSWQKPVDGSQPRDPALEGTAPATETVTLERKAFVHFVEPSKSLSRQFTQIETGDVILDFLGDVVLPRDGAVFIVNGERYIQKDVGKQLTEFWDLMIEGQRHMRTVVASKAPGSG
jgi:hypothetical protein